MGRPPIGKRAMSATERQRRWRQRRRQGQTRARSNSKPTEHVTGPELPADVTALIEQLTRERDQARRELEHALRDVRPKPVGPDNPSRCFVCLRPRSEVEVMLDLSRRRQEVFLCGECIAQMSRMANVRAVRSE